MNAFCASGLLQFSLDLLATIVTGVYGETVLNSLKSKFGFFGYPDELVNMKAMSSEESNSVSEESIGFQDFQKPQLLNSLTDNSNMSMEGSTLEMNGIGLSTSYCNEDFHCCSGRRTENNYHTMLQKDLNSSLNYQQDQGFSSDQQALDSITSSPMSSASNGYPSMFLQTLVGEDPQSQPPLFINQSMNYSTNLNEFSSSFPKLSSMIKPSVEQSQPPTSRLGEKLSCRDPNAKVNNEEVLDSSSVMKKSNTEPAYKILQIQTPSPLSTSKVRKVKLGDRITALQQLVSPFGKTDTASVLFEAIEYIKFLHDQVGVLSTSYMKNGDPFQHQQITHEIKDSEGPKQDLGSRGLCLVPISSTFPVSAETTADFRHQEELSDFAGPSDKGKVPLTDQLT